MDSETLIDMVDEHVKECMQEKRPFSIDEVLEEHGVTQNKRHVVHDYANKKQRLYLDYAAGAEDCLAKMIPRYGIQAMVCGGVGLGLAGMGIGYLVGGEELVGLGLVVGGAVAVTTEICFSPMKRFFARRDIQSHFNQLDVASAKLRERTVEELQTMEKQDAYQSDRYR